jgi:mannose-6-phosphate isomerase
MRVGTTTEVDDPRDGIVFDERPWGAFRRFTLNEPSTVKLITVAAGEQLSLQRHRDRDELWVMLDDGLVVQIGEDTFDTVAGDEHLVPRGVTHRVSAPQQGGRFLEVAFGRFDEDDIERLEDRYGRA